MVRINDDSEDYEGVAEYRAREYGHFTMVILASVVVVLVGLLWLRGCVEGVFVG